MAALSIRNLDQEALKPLKAEAKKEGASVNSLVVRLIEAECGLKPSPRRSVEYHDLDALAGTWIESDASAFDAAMAAFEQIDDALWR